MKRICISKDWKFSKAAYPREYRKVDLPHDYMVTAGRAPDMVGSNGYFVPYKGRYVKFLEGSLVAQKQHYVLDFDGAYMYTQVYFNENLVATHPHGYTPFLVDVTDRMIAGGINKLAVETDPLTNSSRWYSGAGLYRDVFLWTGGKVRIEPWDYFITSPEVSDKVATVNAHFDLSADLNTMATVAVTLSDKDGTPVATGKVELKVKKSGKTPCDIALSVKDPALWCPENPYLYSLHADVRVKDELTDTLDVATVGIRSITFDAVNGCLLNGKPIKMRGGCIHHDHGVLGAAAFPAAEARKIRILKEAGFNAVRIAHNPPSLALLEVCDREGVILMDEAFDMWNIQKTNTDYHLWFADWCERDIAAMVLRDRNHPCVFSYSIGNEIGERDGGSDGAYWSKRLSTAVKKHDTTRPVTAAICCLNQRKDEPSINPAAYYDQPEIKHELRNLKDLDNIPDWQAFTEGYMAPLDIVGYNYRYQRYEADHARFPDRVIWGSETRISHFYREWTKCASLPYVLGSFTWTAYDNMGEVGAGRGVWARDGQLSDLSLGAYPWRTCFQGDHDLCGYRRPQSYFRDAVWRGGVVPRIFTTHPEHFGEGFSGSGWHWDDVHETWTFQDRYLSRPVKCDVYTDADEIVFTLNGREMARAVPEGCIASAVIPYERGTLTATAIKDGKVVGTHTLETTTAPACIMLTPEQTSIKADHRDLAYFRIVVTDKEGRHVPEYAGELSCSVSGGELMGIYSGDPCNEDDYGSNKCHAFEGRALVVVRTPYKGNVTVTVFGEGLAGASARVSAE